MSLFDNIFWKFRPWWNDYEPRIFKLENQMSQVTDEIATMKTKLVNAEHNLALISVGMANVNAKYAALQAQVAAQPDVSPDVQTALDDLATAVSDLSDQTAAAALPFAPPH